MGLPQKVFRDAVSKNVSFNTMLKKMGGGAKIAIPTFLNIIFKNTSTL